jgi:hypothetical protein
LATVRPWILESRGSLSKIVSPTQARDQSSVDRKVTRLSTPISPEPIRAPSNQSIGLDDEHCISNGSAEPIWENKNQSINRLDLRQFRPLPIESDELPTQHNNFSRQ